MKLPDAWARATPIFDDGNLVSFAGLAPVMALAERAGLSELIGERVRFRSTSVASAGVNRAQAREEYLDRLCRVMGQPFDDHPHHGGE